MKIAVFGATSAIAHAVARLYAQEAAHFVLIGRNAERLDTVANDLLVRGASQAASLVADLSDFSLHASLVRRAEEAIGPVDIYLIAQGTLSDQVACEADPAIAIAEISLNFLSAASILTLVASRAGEQGHGSIVVIGSVAGDRGRRSNYVYGSAKAGLGVFVQGLRHRLGEKGINVLLVKPGFVDTPMTAAIEKKGPLWAKPERVAIDIRRGLRRNSAIIYTPWFWRWIMLIIRVLPDAVFKRLSL